MNLLYETTSNFSLKKTILEKIKCPTAGTLQSSITTESTDSTMPITMYLVNYSASWKNDRQGGNLD